MGGEFCEWFLSMQCFGDQVTISILLFSLFPYFTHTVLDSYKNYTYFLFTANSSYISQYLRKDSLQYPPSMGHILLQ